MRLRAAGLVAAVLTAACKTTQPTPPAPPLTSSAEIGVASWYGDDEDGFAGKPTASGQVMDPSRLTAAHRQLPFGSVVRVENLDNGKSVEVIVNDRGPFVRGRVIDLSRAAAAAIGLIDPGTARVRLTVLRQGTGLEPESPTGAWAVQIGAFADRSHADRQRDRAMSYGHRVLLEPHDGVTRVKVGPFDSRSEAEKALVQLESEGFEGIVVPAEG